MNKPTQIKLYGRIVLTGDIRLRTGLHIGTSKETLEIGGVDGPVIRNPVDRLPYIPGSSLKGKMRSLWEKVNAANQNTKIGKDTCIHVCGKADCPVCSIYGAPGESGTPAPTRLIVRDVPLNPASIPSTVVDYTEVKWEAAIDRVTSQASPRQMERVPAGATFSPMEVVFSIYDPADVDRFSDVLRALQLVEDDFLGGQGSRGSGKVSFENLSIAVKAGLEYAEHTDERFMRKSLKELAAVGDDLARWVKGLLDKNGGV